MTLLVRKWPEKKYPYSQGDSGLIFAHLPRKKSMPIINNQEGKVYHGDHKLREISNNHNRKAYPKAWERKSAGCMSPNVIIDKFSFPNKTTKIIQKNTSRIKKILLEKP